MNQALSPVNPELLHFAHKLADSAADIARSHFRQPLDIHHKADHSPVTQADLAIEHALRQLIAQSYPDHGIVGEEQHSHQADAHWLWVIDPIDGTRAFMAGYPLFTTLIALLYQGAPVLGLIDQPISRERWIATAHQPTSLNSVPCRSSSLSQLHQARLATTSAPDYFSPAQSAQFQKLRGCCAHYISGGDAYAYAMLACGHLDVVADAGMKPHDYLALVPIIEGAGGTITDWHGAPLTLTSDGSVLAAACAKLHAEALTALRADAR